MRKYFFAAIFVAVAALGGWTIIAPARGDADATVTIDNFVFKPQDITVAVGTKITWLNRDDIPHVVVSNAGPVPFRSKPLDTDDHFSVTFTTAGAYKYFCSLHPKMVGTITVK